MKQIIILTTLLFNLLSLTAQNGIDNDKAHRRYWYYRTRMINDFMKVGKDQGDCIVMSERNRNGRAGSEIQVGSDQMDISNHYIMALALEYKMLTRGNQNTDETVKELWHMLYTINRLDKEADQFWTNNPPPTNPNITPSSALNGFLMREDVPPDYYSQPQNLYHFNYSMKLSGNTSISASPGNIGVYTGFCGTEYADKLVDTRFLSFLQGPFTPTSTQMDKRDEMGVPTDKFHSMLTALLFVIKYLPDNIYYYENGNPVVFQDNEISLKQEAKNIVFRVYNYMRNGFQGANSWILQYPDYDVLGQNYNNHILNVGSAAIIYSYPLSRMACNANHGFPFNFGNLNCILNGYSDPISSTAGFSAYDAQSSTPGGSEDNAVFKAWDHVGGNMPSGFIPIAAAMQPNSVYWNIKWADLARIVLHQTDAISIPESAYINVLGQAPCSGPYNFGSVPINCDNGGCEFSSQDWIEHPKARGADCATCNNVQGAFTGNYPGVDYMLLHNLYYEYQNQLTFDGSLGNTGGIGGSNLLTAGMTGGIGSNVFGAVYVSLYNASTGIVNAVTTAGCNIANTVSNFFGGNNVCNGTSIPNIPVGNASGGYSKTIYIPYNLMDNYDNSVWPKQIYSGPQAPYVPGNGPASTTNPNSPNNPNNPNSPYNPNNPSGYYANPANFIFKGVTSANQINQAKVGVYQNLTSTAHIYANSSPAASFNTTPSDVRYRAGKEITLLPGFQVDAGSNFHAYVQRYLCVNNSDDWQMRQSGIGDPSISFDNAHYETDFVNQMPIHYVEYPKSDADNNPVVYEENNLNPFLTEQETKELVQQQLVDKQLADQGLYNTNKNLDQRFLITPNPNNGVFTVYVNKVADDEVFSLSIIDMKGTEIKTLNNINVNLIEEINLTEYSKGIYLVKLFSNKGFNATKKISVN